MRWSVRASRANTARCTSFSILRFIRLLAALESVFPVRTSSVRGGVEGGWRSSELDIDEVL